MPMRQRFRGPLDHKENQDRKVRLGVTAKAPNRRKNHNLRKRPMTRPMYLNPYRAIKVQEEAND